MIRVTLKGAKELVQRLRYMTHAAEDLTVPFRQAGVYMVGESRVNINVGGRPKKWKPSHRAILEGGKTLWKRGTLSASIISNAGPRRLAIGVGYPASKYALIHQLGGHTGPRTIRPRNKKALRFKIGGRTIFAKSVNHPGSVIPQREFVKLLPENRREILNLVDDHITGRS